VNRLSWLSQCERDFIVRALGSSQWQIQCCANSLGIRRKNLWEKMDKLGIHKENAADWADHRTSL
jgi:DNA-binding NtrC family response regulator